MPNRKQQKINKFARKGTSTDDEDRTSSQDPMDDVDVHEKSDHGSQTKSHNGNDDNDDMTAPIDNKPDLFYTRCDVKLSISGTTTDHYIQALQQIQLLFTKLKKEDQHLTIAPWSDDSMQPDLLQPSDIPSDENDAEDYFRGLNPRDDKKGLQNLWFKMQFGHVLDLSDSLRSLTRFLSTKKWTVTPLRLQVERATCVGMLQYSHGNMDFEHLARGIEVAINFPVQLRWRVINIGWRSGPLPEEEKIRAIHIEVEAKHTREALTLLSNKFGKTTSTLPGGRRMRFFPEFNRVRSVDNQNKIKEMRKRQGQFLNIIDKVYSHEIHLLDSRHTFKDPKTKTGVTLPTLRQMILEIKSFQPGLEHLSLFHSIDAAWSPRGSSDRGFCFLIMPHLRCEGAMMVQNLLPYLRFLHGPEVERYFTNDCIEANIGIEWDDENKCVKSEIEANMKDDAQDADLIGLDQALSFVSKSQTSSSPVQTTTTEDPPTRPNPQSFNRLDIPINANTAMREYYKPTEDDLPSIGFSATHTAQESPPTTTSLSSSRPTLGNLHGKIIQTPHSTPSRTSTQSSVPSPSAVFNPVITPPSDAQTTASSVTFGSLFTDMERRQAQRDAKQAQLFETMINMMSKITKTPDQHSSQSPPLEGAGQKQ